MCLKKLQTKSVTGLNRDPVVIQSQSVMFTGVCQVASMFSLCVFVSMGTLQSVLLSQSSYHLWNQIINTL